MADHTDCLRVRGRAKEGPTPLYTLDTVLDIDTIGNQSNLRRFTPNSNKALPLMPIVAQISTPACGQRSTLPSPYAIPHSSP